MTDEDAFEFEMVDSEDGFMSWENMSTSSYEICNPESIDIINEDASNKKITMTSTMETVRSLMRKVEETEKVKVAEEAIEEAGTTRAKETNDMYVREVKVQKAALATEMKELLFELLDMLNEADESLQVLDEMHKLREKRLFFAMEKKEEAEKEKLEKDDALEHEQTVIQNIEESKRLEREAKEILQLQEFVTDRGQVIDTLEEAVSCRCQSVNMLEEELIDYEEENEILDTEYSSSPIIPH